MRSSFSTFVLAADVGFEPTSYRLEICRSHSAELIGCAEIGLRIDLNSQSNFVLVDVFGIAPNSSALQTDANLSQLNVLEI